MFKENNLLKGSIIKSLTLFTIPILISLIFQALYTTVDLWMVSRFGVDADISAVSTGGQSVSIATGFIIGLSMGITILLGQSIGERNNQKSANIVGSSIYIFGVLTIIITIGMSIFAPMIANVLNTPTLAFDKTVTYIIICSIGFVFIVGYNILASIFLATGDSKTPLIYISIACVVNILADYILINSFDMGAMGAAFATILAQAVSVILCLISIKKRLPFKIGKENMRFNKELSMNIIKLGAPIALLRMCNEFSYFAILGFVNTLGVVASSGVGIAEKLVMFILLIPTAYMSSISTFVAQNEGAKNPSRARKGLFVGMITSTLFGGAMALISFFYGDVLSSWFVNDPLINDASHMFLKATSIECFIFSIACCFEGYFNGIGKTTFVMIEGITAALCVRVPFAYYQSINNPDNLFMIGLSTSIAALYMLLLSSGYFLYLKLKKNHKPKVSV